MSNISTSWEFAFEEVLLGKKEPQKSSEVMVIPLDQNSCTYVSKLWEGIVLWANDIHMNHISYPDYGDKHCVSYCSVVFIK